MRLTFFRTGETKPWVNYTAIGLGLAITFALIGGVIAAAPNDPAPLVTNLPEQSRGFYGGVLATIAVLAVVAREIPALLRFIKGRRNGHHRRESNEYDTPVDHLRTHPGGQTIDEIRAAAKAEALEEAREQTRITLLTARMDAAWAYLDEVKAWRLTLAERLGTLPTGEEMADLSRKIDELRNHTDALANAARKEITAHVAQFHIPRS